MSAPKICPLIAMGNVIHQSKCRGDGCAWWRAGTCVLVGIAAALEDKKTALDAANIQNGKGGTDLTRPNSTPNDTKEQEDLQL